MGGSPGLVVMGRDSCPKVVGSNPSIVYWMDMFSNIFVVKIVMFVENTKITKKKPEWPITKLLHHPWVLGHFFFKTSWANCFCYHFSFVFYTITNPWLNLNYFLGQQWLWQTLGIQPKASWSVDPFGHSGTQAYVLKASGIDSVAIMRIHRWEKILTAFNQICFPNKSLNRFNDDDDYGDGLLKK